MILKKREKYFSISVFQYLALVASNRIIQIHILLIKIGGSKVRQIMHATFGFFPLLSSRGSSLFTSKWKTPESTNIEIFNSGTAVAVLTQGLQ